MVEDCVETRRGGEQVSIACCPDCTVNWALTRRLTLSPLMARASLKPWDRSCVRVSVWMPVISPMMASVLPLSFWPMYWPAFHPTL